MTQDRRIPKPREIDYYCEKCDPPRIYKGPHKGETFTEGEQVGEPSTEWGGLLAYKGAPISHTAFGCPRCAAKALRAYRKERGGG